MPSMLFCFMFDAVELGRHLWAYMLLKPTSSSINNYKEMQNSGLLNAHEE